MGVDRVFGVEHAIEEEAVAQQDGGSSNDVARDDSDAEGDSATIGPEDAGSDDTASEEG